MAGLVLVTAPVIEPVSLSEAKAHLRVTSRDEDLLISSQIKAASARARQYFRRENAQSTWDQTFDKWEEFLVLRKKPLVSVTSVTYLDPDGAPQTLATTVWEAVTNREPGYVRRKFGQSWPPIRAHGDVVTVRYLAGYATVPELQKAYVKLLVALLYEFREPTITGTIQAKIEDLEAAFSGERMVGAV